jgi:hypothetical protein
MMANKNKELKSGKSVCVGGRTYKGGTSTAFIPLHVVESLSLSDKLFISSKRAAEKASNKNAGEESQDKP